MLSLNPRSDLFKFRFPKDFLPKEIEEKYSKYLSMKSAVINSPIEYLNESVQRIEIPGITDLVLQQQQHSSNSIEPTRVGVPGLGRINVEPKTDISYNGSDNPLDRINKEFKVTFRYNQGYMNYFMIFETIFYRFCKPLNHPCDPVFIIDLLSETGNVISRIELIDVYIDGIDGIELDYTKLERNDGTFTITFKFNNINYDMLLDNIETFD